MADKAHRLTDEKLEEMEKRLSAIYSRAEREIQKTADEYFARFAKQDEAKRKLLEQGKITEDEYKKWRKGKLMYGKRFTETKEQCAKQLLNVNQTALAYVNGELPEVYAINYNALAGSVDGVGGYSFTLVDADTVRNLAVTDTSLLPYKEIDPAKDIPWNMKKINAETLQGILQGESMDKIAKRIMNVQTMNKDAAIRSARTIVTGAECKGRQDSYQRAKDDGIILRKYWLATYDKRARDWHKEAGNKYNEDNAIEIDEFFVVDGEDMLHPGDSEHGAGGHNIYNCRCSIASKVIGFKKAQVQKAMAEKQEEAPKLETSEQIQSFSSQNLRSAYNSHIDANNLRKARAEDVGELVGVDYSKLQTESARAFQSTFDELTSEYDTPLSRVRMMDKKDALFRKDSFAYTTHNYETDDAEIIINPLKCGDYEKYIGRIKELSQKGWSVKIPDKYADRYVATHEFAHTLANLEQPLVNSRNWVNADYGKIKSFRKEVKGVYDKYIADVGFLDSERKRLEAKIYFEGVYTQKDMDDLKECSALLKSKKISNYSMSNADEFMAEAFTHAKLADSKNEYADSVLGIIYKYYKR